MLVLLVVVTSLIATLIGMSSTGFGCPLTTNEEEAMRIQLFDISEGRVVVSKVELKDVGLTPEFLKIGVVKVVSAEAVGIVRGDTSETSVWLKGT